MPTTPEEIADTLRRDIRTRAIEPGTLLNQNHLAKQIGVSRIPLREALRALTSEGLVVLEPGRGARVAALDPMDIADLYDLRLKLEPPQASEIIDNISPAETRQIDMLATAMGKADDKDHWSILNFTFHERLYGVIDRPHTLRIVLQIMSLVEPYSRLYVHLLSGLERASQEHTLMVDAINSGDVEALEENIRQHLIGARDALLSEVDRVWAREDGTTAALAMPPLGTDVEADEPGEDS